MFKKLLPIVIVLTALLATATPSFADTIYCDPPATQGKPRATSILCYYDTSPGLNTTEMGTWEQPFKARDRAVAEAQAHNYGGTVWDKKTGEHKYFPHVISGGAGAPISRTILFILLGLASLILVTAGWFLRRRALPRQA